MATRSINRVKLYAAPEVTTFLTNQWLLSGSFEGGRKIEKILPQFGLRGNTTAFLDIDKQKETICFVHEKNAKVFMRFFKDSSSKLAQCIIPKSLYNKEYDHTFAIVEDEMNYTYFDADFSNCRVTPRFIQKYFSKGISCVEISNSATLLYCFEVEKPLSNLKVNITLNIPNNKEALHAVEALSNKIFDILLSGNGKEVYRYYTEVHKLLTIPADFQVVCIHTDDGADKNLNSKENSDYVTDEIIFEDGNCKKFMLSVDSKKFTLFENFKWYYTDNFIKINNENNKISFEGNLTEVEISELKPLNELVADIKQFFYDNMVFAFN